MRCSKMLRYGLNTSSLCVISDSFKQSRANGVFALNKKIHLISSNIIKMDWEK